MEVGENNSRVAHVQSVSAQAFPSSGRSDSWKLEIGKRALSQWTAPQPPIDSIDISLGNWKLEKSHRAADRHLIFYHPETAFPLYSTA
ncbi:MAG: hypothetical protein JWL90_4743 [Chthoniobacteraceae bacterium]|nr:hypothetical protein [Chthoniobacteraceae bacterium]